MSELDMKGPPYFHPKVAHCQISRKNHQHQARSGLTRFHLVVFLLLLLSSLDLWIHPFRPLVGFIKHDTMNQKPKPNREVGRNSSFWECTTVGSCPSCHSYQSMDDDFVSCKVPRCRDKAPDSCRVITQVGSFLPAFDNKEVPPILQRDLSTFE